MIFATGLSIAIRLMAVFWSIVLLRRIKDWRIGFLTIMFLLMAVRQSLTLWNTPAKRLTDLSLTVSELPGLIVSIMAFLSIFSLEKILTAPKKAEKNLKESEKSLQKSQTLFHTLANASPVGIFRTNERGLCTYVNDRWCEISGLTLEEAQNNGWASALHPVDRDQVFSEWEKFSQEGNTFQMEYRFLNASGKTSWVFGQAEAERDPDNKVIGYVGTITDITQQKLTEIALKKSQTELEKRVEERTADYAESEERFRKIFEEGGIGMVMATPDFCFTKANQAFCEMIGYTEEELKSKTFLDITHPEDIHKNRELIQKLVNQKISSFQMEKRCLCKDDRVIWVNINVFINRVKGQDPSYRFVGVMENITARKEIEEKLVVSEERFRKVFEEGSIGMVVAGPDKYFDKANQAFCKLIGYSEEEIKTKTFIDITHPLDIEKDLDLVKKLNNREISSFQNEKRYIRKDGKVIWVDLNAFIIQVHQGDSYSYHYIGLVTDITHRKEIEDQLAESEEKFRQIAENVEEVFWMEDVEGSNIIYISPAFEKVWGISLEVLFKNPQVWMESIHPEDRPIIENLKLYENRKKLLSGSQKHEFRIIRPDGSIRWILDKAFPVVNTKGEPVRIVGISQDITDLKLAQQEAEQASNAKSEFLSHMSHELRTPLNAILGFAQLLEMNKKKNLEPRQKEGIRQIRIAGSHLLELINEVLDLSRIETGSFKIFKENTDVTRLLKRLVPLVEPLAIERNIQIENHISDVEPLYVMADPTRLKQALINLVTNAIKYNREGGNVLIKSEETDKGRIQIHIIDTGPGIDIDKQESIFEPFERLGAEASGIEGTGIGLTITQKLIQLMDGSVLVTSDLGKGSCFTLELPPGNFQDQNVSELVPSLKRNPEWAPGIQGCETILYIEDNLSNLMLVQRYLEEFTSYKFISSLNAKEGLEQAKSSHPSLILMDINLPDMDGFAALEALLLSDDTKSIPVIAVSANAMDHDIKTAINAGFKNYLTKPLDLDCLANTIHNILENGRP